MPSEFHANPNPEISQEVSKHRYGHPVSPPPVPDRLLPYQHSEDVSVPSRDPTLPTLHSVFIPRPLPLKEVMSCIFSGFRFLKRKRLLWIEAGFQEVHVGRGLVFTVCDQ